jgi:predicted HAD superfamily phosphohydrolase YqeG
MDEELLERKKLQRKRIRGLLIVLDLTLLAILVYDVVRIVQNWW